MIRTPSKTVITGCILILASILTTWAAFAMRDRDQYFLSEGINTNATITGKREISKAHKKSRMYVSYEFAADNKIHNDTVSWRGDTKTWQALQKGDKIEVTYIIDRDTYDVKSEVTQNFDGKIQWPILVIGGLFFVVGLVAVGKGM